MKVYPELKIFSHLDQVYQTFSPECRSCKSLVFVNGTMDLFHAGHASLLNRSAELGDLLLVFINTDESIRTLKGSGRPILPLEHRQLLIASLQCVDGVFAFPDARVTDYLEKIRPNFWVKASDYTMDTIEVHEKEMAKKVGIEIVILPKVDGLSSTKLIKRIRDSV